MYDCAVNFLVFFYSIFQRNNAPKDYIIELQELFMKLGESLGYKKVLYAGSEPERVYDIDHLQESVITVLEDFEIVVG